jgi:uncharacterized membrane protein
MISTLRAILLASALTMCGQSVVDAVAADAPVAAGFSGDLNALGTEPFWAVTIRGDGLTFSRPGEDDVRNANPGAVIAKEAATWTIAGGSAPFKLTLTKEACSDGMSDRHYAFKAVLAFQDKTLYGCADTPAAIAAQPAP